MLIYDDSFAAAMTATRQEATDLGAHVYGSEHLLLGLLAEGGPLAEVVSGRDGAVTYDAVRRAVTHAIDDAPLLEGLGVSVVASGLADAPRPRRTPRNRHSPELQAAMSAASAKWGRLRKSGDLPRESRLDSTVLWLAVLEPPARSYRLVEALGADPDGLRAAVLGAAAVPGAPVPAWPTEVRRGPVTRLVHRLMDRGSRSE